MITFPDWADLGMSDISSTARNTFEAEMSRAMQYWVYYTGHIFKEKVETMDPADDPPLMYPVGLNLVKMMVLAHADTTYGEYERDPLTFSTHSHMTRKDADQKAARIMSDVMDDSFAASMLWEVEAERHLFGGGAIKIAPDLQVKSGIRWQRIAKSSFFPVWDPSNKSRLLKVYVFSQLNKEQAKLKYGITTHKDTVPYVEEWTVTRYSVKVDGKLVEGKRHNWGVVPFIYVPRFRLGNWFGESLTDDLMRVQDEINMRIGDIGEAINYNAHPIRWGVNLPIDFDNENYPLGSDTLWDLGRQLGNSPAPEVGILELKNPVPQSVFNYVKFIYDWARTAAFAPPIAFGEDDGGGQRSGITLEIRMWPLLKAAKRSRTYLHQALEQGMRITAKILKQKGYSKTSKSGLKSLLDERITANMSPILPRDQNSIVDRVTKLLSIKPPLLSLETALKELDYGMNEMNLILEMLEDEKLAPFFKTAFEENEEGEEKENEEKKDEEKEAPEKETS